LCWFGLVFSGGQTLSYQALLSISYLCKLPAPTYSLVEVCDARNDELRTKS